MAKHATAGEMRTRIRILKPVDKQDNAKYRNTEYTNIYPDGRTIHCKWQGAFGQEAVQAYSLGLTDAATLTMRYDPRITGDCIVERLGPDGSQSQQYKIITEPNDVDGAHRYVEFKVSRKGKAV